MPGTSRGTRPSPRDPEPRLWPEGGVRAGEAPPQGAPLALRGLEAPCEVQFRAQAGQTPQTPPAQAAPTAEDTRPGALPGFAVKCLGTGRSPPDRPYPRSRMTGLRMLRVVPKKEVEQ